jgi:hypothetical protein
VVTETNILNSKLGRLLIGDEYSESGTSEILGKNRPKNKANISYSAEYLKFQKHGVNVEF